MNHVEYSQSEWDKMFQTALETALQGDSAPLKSFTTRLKQAAWVEPSILNRYADALMQYGVYPSCLELFTLSLALDDQQFPAQVHAGLAHHQQGQLREAVAQYDRALGLRADVALVHSNRADALDRLGRSKEAIASAKCGIVIDPSYVDAWYNLGICSSHTEASEMALAAYDRATTLHRGHERAWTNRGKLLQETGDLEEAAIHHQHALVIQPGLPEALLNYASIQPELRTFETALRFYDHAICINPRFARAQLGRAITQLLLGRFAEGWTGYEWRLYDTEQSVGPRHRHLPAWTGQDITDKRLLVYWEQGLGDTLQFSRYAALLASTGVKVSLEVQPELVSLIESLHPQIHVTSAFGPRESADFRVPLLSLPLWMKTRIETIPNQTPYLAPPKDCISAWQERLQPAMKPRVGIVWSGSLAHRNDAQRSLVFADIAPWLELPIEFHCLQKVIRPQDQPAVWEDYRIHTHGPQLEDFSDTAGLIAGMDLVISVDTSVAHLAGALGKPLWVLLAYTPDFRWLLDREDSPWYPTARLFRQASTRDWTSVIKAVREHMIRHFDLRIG